MSRSHRYTQSCSVVLAMWSLVPHTTTLLISWNGSAIVVDAIFANNLLQFRRQLRFVPSTTDIKCHATTNHRLTSVCQAATVAHPVHRAYGSGGEFQEEGFYPGSSSFPTKSRFYARCLTSRFFYHAHLLNLPQSVPFVLDF